MITSCDFTARATRSLFPSQPLDSPTSRPALCMHSGGWGWEQWNAMDASAVSRWRRSARRAMRRRDRCWFLSSVPITAVSRRLSGPTLPPTCLSAPPPFPPHPAGHRLLLAVWGGDHSGRVSSSSLLLGDFPLEYRPDNYDLRG